MNRIAFIDNFIDNPTELFSNLKNNAERDERMSSRKTASYGKAYNYSKITYPFQEFTAELHEIIEKLNNILNFKPNNCLVNYTIWTENLKWDFTLTK